jgi:hypothetical protein
MLKGLFVWAGCAAMVGKLMFWVSLFGDLAGCLAYLAVCWVIVWNTPKTWERVIFLIFLYRCAKHQIYTMKYTWYTNQIFKNTTPPHVECMRVLSRSRKCGHQLVVVGIISKQANSSGTQSIACRSVCGAQRLWFGGSRAACTTNNSRSQAETGGNGWDTRRESAVG